jgi:hypothetical protein
MTSAELNAWLHRDDRELVDAIKAEIRNHVNRLHAEGTEFYGYAILPGDTYSIQNLVAAFNAESDLAPERANQSYYRYSVDEWANYEQDQFTGSSRLIESRNAQFRQMHVKENPDDYVMDEFEVAHSDKLLESILAAMTELRQEGLFGGEKSFAVIWIPDSEHPIMNKSAEALNSSEVYESFIEEFGG